MDRGHRARRIVGLAAVLAAGALGACESQSHRDIQDEINVVIRRNDALVPPAMKRLAGYGRLAIPQIETAIHTAAPAGRLALVRTLDAIGDAESVSILRTFAVYDTKPEVRAECEAILKRWAAAAGARGERAREALARVAEKRSSGEGPAVFGDGGTPGVPATVGAPDPIGANLERKSR